MNQMNILVTGGAGFIGSVTTAQLIEAGHHVVVYDNLSHGHKEAVDPKATFIQGDIADKEKVKSALIEYTINAVVHFAAFIEAGESMQYPERLFANNTVNTLNLLELLIAHDIRRFVFSSTAAVYGNPKKIPIAEDSETLPTNAYGASKLLVEQTLSWYHQIHGFRYAALRYFNASGATENLGENHTPETHLIPLAIQAATGKRKALQLYGTDYSTKDGTCVRDYIHVSDLARAHVLALDALETHTTGKLIYNLGSQHGFTNKEVIEAVGNVVGKRVPCEDAPRRTGDPAILIASSEKIEKELGWKAKFTNIEDIISSTYKWYLAHPQGYSS